MSEKVKLLVNESDSDSDNQESPTAQERKFQREAKFGASTTYKANESHVAYVSESMEKQAD